ncbi:MAG: TIR domain-containing protein [Prevotella sp.]|nr:TIR domain-containing protein [Prevotella sp.]
MEQTKYDVFISYSRKDYVDGQQKVIPGNVVSKIKERLTCEGITYWFDEEGIYSGQNFVEKIVTNIEASKLFVYISTKNANQSNWTVREIASADELGKHIIPLRVDKTPYNRQVLFRIANLDYIDYYTNPEKGEQELVNSIKEYLKQMAMEEKRKKEEEEHQRELERKKVEEEQRRKEQEEKRHREEQERIVTEIRVGCSTLNGEETKLAIDRNNLLLSVQRVEDNRLRHELITLITESSPIRKKTLEESGKQVLELQKQVQEWQIRFQAESAQRARLQRELNDNKFKSTKSKKAEMDYAGSSNKGLSKKFIHLIYGIVIMFLLLMLIGALGKDSQPTSLSEGDVATKDTTCIANGESSSDKPVAVATPTATSLEFSFKIGKALYTGPLDESGAPDGEGVAIFSNKDEFRGFFSHGRFVRGRYTCNDGSYIEGDFKDDEPEKGKSTYYDKNGKKL